MKHRHSVWHGSDADYVVYQQLIQGSWWAAGYWLIPGSYREA